MSQQAPALSTASTPAGEGERRAQRGYVPQYDLGARIIYEALAAGRLRWIGVADRSAGTFDDIVLGLHDQVIAHQLKTSRDPRPFSIRTVLLGAERLWQSIVETYRKLRTDHPHELVEVIYACDDYPRADDDLGGSVRPVSTSAFLRAHEAHRRSWSLTEWHQSAFSGFVADLQTASRLGAADFEEILRGVRFLAGGQARYLGLVARGPAEQRRLQEIASLLPRLVADASDRDRWSASELLARLGWRDPFALKHGHAFPTDPLYQSNFATQDRLRQVLANVTAGYIGLEGPPGSGKSTLLAAGVLPTPRASVVRYVAFLPDEGHGLGRAEAEDFLHDLVAQLKQQGLGSTLTPGSQLGELREQFAVVLREAGERFRSGGVRTLIVVDGLDHVPREERPAHSFLSVFPHPQAVPEGVVFVLGTQRLDLEDIPPEVTRQASAEDRRVTVTPLPREAVARFAGKAGLPPDVDLDELHYRTGGHPLSLRYATEALRYANTPEDRREWLRSGPEFGGNIEVFYRRVWDYLERNSEARRALQYVALAEGPIHPRDLDRLVGEDGTDAAWQAARHLLVRNYRGAWSIFHNSFRLFLQDRVSLRHGVRDTSRVQGLYADLARMTQDPATHPPQRWLELRYRARANDHTGVAALARSDRFRSQFAEGRNPGEIQNDIGFALKAAGALRRPGLVIDMLLARHEIVMRCDAIGDEVFDALLRLGDVRAAHGLLDSAGVVLSIDKGSDLVEAYISDGEIEEARRLFDDIEPVAKLLGAEEIDPRRDEDLIEWAETALLFREPDRFVELLGHLRAPGDREDTPFDIEAYRTHLKLIALRGHLERDPLVSLMPLEEAIRLPREAHASALVLAASVTAATGHDEQAVLHIEAARDLPAPREPWMNRELAKASARVSRYDLAELFFKDLATPNFAAHEQDYSSESFRSATREIVEHAALAVTLGHQPQAAVRPKSRYLAAFQDHLVATGTLLGEGRKGGRPSADSLRRLIAATTFLQHGKPDDPHDPARWRIDGVIDEAVKCLVAAAAALGSETLTRFAEFMDGRIHEEGRLSRAGVRRAYALSLYEHDFDAERALSRLSQKEEVLSTPAEEVAEMAHTARALARMGFEARARDMLNRALAGSVGYSRAAKKDPQYIAWRALFGRACEEDPGGRQDRLLFFGRLLTGMATTEGENAGRRLVRVFLEQAAQAGPPWAAAAADRMEELGLSTWPDLAAALVVGAARTDPDLCAAASVVFGRVALPFSGDEAQEVFEVVASLAPDQDVEAIVRHAVACIGPDSHPARRILLLEALLKAASSRGVSDGVDALNRWLAELPPPRSGNSPEDPFFRVQTLAEMASVLQHGGEAQTPWNAGRAFERLAPAAGYAAAKALFDSSNVLKNDERATEVIGRMAVAAGQRADATAYLARLTALEGNRGAWGFGGYTNAKLRRYRLEVQLNGEIARRAAFDEFVSDLSDRRESVESILPDLDDILELVSPSPTWAETWAHLQEHLSRFREYKLGRELDVSSQSTGGAEEVLADILFRAIDTTALDLAKMARAAALELIETPGGAPVVTALFRRLWRTGGRHALEAAQIAWECRESNAVRDALLSVLPEMCDASDLAVSRSGVRLARVWGQLAPVRRADLPVPYRLEMPPNPEAERFEPPSGSSATSSGLVTDDPYSWTWPLERPLRLAAKASGLRLPNIRARAAQLMSRMGGIDAFGPTAIQGQQRRLSRLGLHVRHQKLPVAAAFRAMREVAGELAAAEVLDERVVSLLLQQSGAYLLNVATIAPTARPPGVPRSNIPDLYGEEKTKEWLASASDDAFTPVVADGIVLAATSYHERRHFRRTWTAEQYFGPELGHIEGDLSAQLSQLPRVVVEDNVVPLYDGLAPRGVASAARTISSSIEDGVVTLCPRVAAALGWIRSRRNVFTYLDRTGAIAARTIHWRDGGILCSDVDSAVFSEGYVLVAATEKLEELGRYLLGSTVALSWRAAEGSE